MQGGKSYHVIITLLEHPYKVLGVCRENYRSRNLDEGKYKSEIIDIILETKVTDSSSFKGKFI